LTISASRVATSLRLMSPIGRLRSGRHKPSKWPGNDPERPFEHIAFTAPFNMSEQPAASICAGYDTEGLPIGLQIVGHRFDDLGVLCMASAYETMRPRQRVWPEP
jgi:aspartyl-tRNA(Asn)/glutamyl-tRNA(Gln) amidotransferase subunit A